MSQSVAVAQLLISLGAVWFIWSVLLNRLFRDITRSRIQRVRQDLFHYMLENAKDFNGAQYRAAEAVFDKLLMIADRLSPMFVLYVFATTKRSRKGDSGNRNEMGSAQIKSVVDELDEDSKSDDLLTKRINEALSTAIMNLVYLFLFGFVVGWVTAIVCLIHYCFQKIKQSGRHLATEVTNDFGQVFLESMNSIPMTKTNTEENTPV